MKIIGKFDKDKRYSIVEMNGKLFALFNLKDELRNRGYKVS